MAEGLPSTQALLMFSLFSDWASQGYQGKVRLRRHICHIVRISFKLFLQIGVNDAMITAIRACETHLHNVISISKVRPLFRSKLVHLSNVYCCDMSQNDTIDRIELFPLSSCQVIILIARMTFNCSTSCLMS